MTRKQSVTNGIDTNYNSAIRELTVRHLGYGYEKCRIQVWNIFPLLLYKIYDNARVSILSKSLNLQQLVQNI